MDRVVISGGAVGNKTKNNVFLALSFNTSISGFGVKGFVFHVRIGNAHLFHVGELAVLLLRTLHQLHIVECQTP